MADYIDRQAAIDAVSEACFELRGVFGRCEDALKDLPSADVVEVVYCSECKYWNELLGVCQRRQKLYGYGVNDYCSKGERITDGEIH